MARALPFVFPSDWNEWPWREWLVMTFLALTPSTQGSALISARVAFQAFLPFTTDLADRVFMVNYDWDPSYLRYIFSQDFFEFCELWSNGMGDQDMIWAAEASERYCPVVENISLDNDTLYYAVAQIKNEWVWGNSAFHVSLISVVIGRSLIGGLLYFRMARPDSVQYFQFDSKGNMYIYAPGAEYTGEAKFMAPGDDLIFSNNMQWDQRSSPLLSEALVKEEMALASTCPAEMSHNFKEPLYEDQLI